MRRVEKDLVKIRRPFAIFVEPCLEIDGHWNVSIVGCELDNYTYGRSPGEALESALEVVRMLSGECSRSPGLSCELVRETIVDGELAWGCRHCSTVVRAAYTEEIDD